MDLKNLKEQLSKAGFSEEALSALNSILDSAIAKGTLSEEDQKKMSEIIDKEIEQSKTQASIMEEIAFGLEDYAGELDQTIKIADEKEKSVEEDFNSEMDDLEEQTKQVSAPNTPPEAASIVQ